MPSPNEEREKLIRYWLKIIGFFLLLILIIGIVLRLIDHMRLRSATDKEALLTVATVAAKQESPTEEIVLPGNVTAWHEATINARTSGYITQWFVDIGTHVKAGEVLAIIATPEVDAQLRQAEADLNTAQANYNLSRTTAIRWQGLLKTNSVSKQEADERTSDAIAKEAVVVSMRANRDRLRDLVNFQKVVAPFDGIITSRTIDIGRLIDAGSSSLRPLFHIAQSDKLRVYIRVPQNYSAQITSGVSAQLHFSEHPGKVYKAKLLNTANAIDVASRTLLVQLMVPNQNDELTPGSYAQVHLILPTPKNSLLIPVNTLLFRAEGLQVATIDGDSTVVLKSITIGRDFGDQLEVTSGLKPNETVILNPSDSMLQEQKVRVVKSNQKNTPGTKT